MTGAGASSVAFVKEDSFNTLPGTPTYYLPGRNVTVDELSLSNELARLRTPDNAEAVDSLAGNLDGSFSVSYAMSADTHADVRDIVFNDAGGGLTSGLATTSRWYLGAEYVDGSGTSVAERELKGCIPLSYSITYDVGTNTVRESLSMGFADEERNTSLTPGSVTGPTDGSEVPFHGTSLDIDGVTIEKPQSITLSFDNLYRFQDTNSRTPTDPVLANPTTTLETGDIYSGPSPQHNAAYGGSGVTTTQDQLANVAGTLTFDSAGSTVATYDLPKLKPDNYDWGELVNADEDLMENVTYFVGGGVSIT